MPSRAHPSSPPPRAALAVEGDRPGRVPLHPRPLLVEDPEAGAPVADPARAGALVQRRGGARVAEDVLAPLELPREASTGRDVAGVAGGAELAGLAVAGGAGGEEGDGGQEEQTAAEGRLGGAGRSGWEHGVRVGWDGQEHPGRGGGRMGRPTRALREGFRLPDLYSPFVASRAAIQRAVPSFQSCSG